MVSTVFAVGQAVAGGGGEVKLAMAAEVVAADEEMVWGRELAGVMEVVYTMGLAWAMDDLAG